MKVALEIQRVAPEVNVCPKKNQFKQWINLVLDRLLPKGVLRKTSISICIRLVDRKESAHLNSLYRKKIGPTNILSFSNDLLLSSLPVYLLGDLVICSDLVVEEASTQNKSVLAHWAHLTVHGILHLLGYDHVAEDEAVRMEALEKELLGLLGFANPYE